MNEISNQVFAFFDELAREHDLDVDELLADLPVTAAQLRRPGDRFSWDVLAVLCERFEQRLGRETLRDSGRMLPRSRLIEPLRRLGGVLVSPRFMYELVGRWLAPDQFLHADFAVQRRGRDALEVRATIKPGFRDAPEAWFITLAAGMEALPTFLGLPVATVELQLTPRQGRFLVQLPPTGLRDRMRQASKLFASGRALDELVAQQAELRRSEIARADATTRAHEREQFARVVLDRVQELIAIVELDTTPRYLNPACEQLLGYRTSELRGRPLHELVHPDDQPRLMELLVNELPRSGGVTFVEARVRSRDGHWHDLELTSANLRHDPAVRGILINGRDVTERRTASRALAEHERQYAALLGNLSGMAYRCRNDEDWTLELASDGALALTGYTADELVESRVVAFGSLIVPEDAGPLLHKCQANLAAHRPCANEYRIRTRNGQVRWVLDLASGVWDDAGALQWIEGFITDVTARKQLEEQLSHAQRLESVGRLAGGIAHDFNNLLGAMLSFAELGLDDVPKDSSVAEDLRGIRDACRRAADLTRQLLTFARKQVLQPRVLDVNALVAETDRLLRRVLGDDIEFTWVPGPALWAVEVDPSQLEQVLMNLAVNARQAMPTGGHLTVETANVSLDEAYAMSHADVKAGDYAMIAVSDTGEGMTPEVQRRIFEPFFTTKGDGGNGLGLATCYGIVQQAGGHVYVYSELGRGTTFKIYLPRSRAPLDAPQNAEPPPRKSAGEAVLLVEDHLQVRNAMVRTLERAGYRLLLATSATQALALADAHPGAIDLLVTDVVMPGHSGHALALRLQALRPSLKVLYVSGYTENSVIHHGVPASGVHFLAKPFSPLDLLRKVRHVLDG